MSINISQYYVKYKGNDIVLSLDVIGALGLIASKISFKCNGKTYPCVLYSSSMANARILAHVNEYFFKILKENKQLIALRFTFKPRDHKSEFSFYINSKVKNFNQYQSVKSDLYFLNLEFVNKPPDDLIEILGEYQEQQHSLEKRIYERIILNSDFNDTLGIHPIETFLFADGKGKRCFLTEISIFSAKILINSMEDEFKKAQTVILLMKMQGLQGMGEMFGLIEDIEIFNKEEALTSIVINFDQERIPPSYKMWIGECIEILKGKMPMINQTR